MCEPGFAGILWVGSQQYSYLVATEIKLAKVLKKVHRSLRIHNTLPQTSTRIPAPSSTTVIGAGTANWSLRVNREKCRPSLPSIATSYRWSRKRSDRVGLM